jgi:cob(I)alamin adenosyltransferase
MVRLNRIYTRTGDDGTTGLGTGERRPKHDPRVEAYGTVDEANAAIGLARLHAVDEPDLDRILARVQNDLFDLGADLCTPDDGMDRGYAPLRIVPEQTAKIEADIDRLNADLTPLRSFVLPAGTPLSAHLHVARTVARRAERMMTALGEREPVAPAAIGYINRLSDLLFVMARYANRGVGDALWVPGGER